MNDKIVILSLVILCGVVSLYLYIWQAKKQMQYKGDERWKMIQIKANNITKRITDTLVALMFSAGAFISVNKDIKVNTTVMHIALYIMFFWGIRNAVELFSSLYFDKHL
ncbi:DUF2178 domain-containing protein [Inconstantimicrobium porci]|uniref:DUF2178 domain-containing protein n=1 Tax=Inconstantimicrobium porci TaxID=2652291 RepID=UPI002409FAF4|nr:DUF2178 domain-containing protein [Inconstantimicrobium porci]MDD6770398.1 DUF2178 domain-containing protein [Inconstantimicrobium porci]